MPRRPLPGLLKWLFSGRKKLRRKRRKEVVEEVEEVEEAVPIPAKRQSVKKADGGESVR